MKCVLSALTSKPIALLVALLLLSTAANRHANPDLWRMALRQRCLHMGFSPQHD